MPENPKMRMMRTISPISRISRLRILGPITNLTSMLKNTSMKMRMRMRLKINPEIKKRSRIMNSLSSLKKRISPRRMIRMSLLRKKMRRSRCLKIKMGIVNKLSRLRRLNRNKRLLNSLWNRSNLNLRNRTINPRKMKIPLMKSLMRNPKEKMVKKRMTHLSPPLNRLSLFSPLSQLFQLPQLSPYLHPSIPVKINSRMLWW